MLARNQQLKLIIFDCDGTLVDSQHVIIKAMRTAFESQNFKAPPDQNIREIIGLSLDEAVAALAPPCKTRQLADLVEAYKSAFVAQRQAVDFHEPLFTGAREILQNLADRDNFLLGVATGKSRRGLDVLFERENLAQFFFNIQTADNAPSKPHPGMIENALNETGIERKNVLMIGDTSYDMEMARNADVGAIGVCWGYHDEQKLQAAGAHRLISSFDEILQLSGVLEAGNG